jgi:hypothetical protein
MEATSSQQSWQRINPSHRQPTPPPRFPTCMRRLAPHRSAAPPSQLQSSSLVTDHDHFSLTAARRPAPTHARAALDRRSNEHMVVELRAIPTQHRPQEPASPRRSATRHGRTHRRPTHRLPQPLEPQLTAYPLRSLAPSWVGETVTSSAVQPSVRTVIHERAPLVRGCHRYVVNRKFEPGPLPRRSDHLGRV